MYQTSSSRNGPIRAASFPSRRPPCSSNASSTRETGSAAGIGTPPMAEADQPQLSQAIEAAEAARRHSDDADRLAPQDSRHEVVECILEGARVAILVLRGDDQKAVRDGQLRAQFDRSGGRAIGVAEPVAHDGKVQVCQVDSLGVNPASALELAEKQPGNVGTPATHAARPEEHWDSRPHLLMHWSGLVGCRS